MKRSRKILISALSVALFLLFGIHQNLSGLPLTHTVYSIPEEEVELVLSEEASRLNENYRVDSIGLGFGALPGFSLWFSFNYLHKSLIRSGESELGDSFLKLFFYIGDFFDDTLSAGFLARFRLPTGDDAFSGSRWSELSFGKNELALGPVFQVNIKTKVFIHVNLLYVFREGANEGFYNGLTLKLLDKETYKDFFGLNPSTENSFLYSERLKNDYYILSLAVNTNVIYPVIPFAEIFFLKRFISKGSIVDGEPDLLPAGVNPLLFSVGINYFFSRSNYLGAYVILNPGTDRNLLSKAGLTFGLQF